MTRSRSREMISIDHHIVIRARQTFDRPFKASLYGVRADSPMFGTTDAKYYNVIQPARTITTSRKRMLEYSIMWTHRMYLYSCKQYESKTNTNSWCGPPVSPTSYALGIIHFFLAILLSSVATSPESRLMQRQSLWWAMSSSAWAKNMPKPCALV